MRVTGFEPVLCYQNWILSPGCLPFHHTRVFCIIFKIMLAGSRTRTGTSVENSADFKSAVYTNFTIPAYLIVSYLTLLIQYSIFQKFCQEVLSTFSLLFQLHLTFCIIPNFLSFVKSFCFFFYNQSISVGKKLLTFDIMKYNTSYLICQEKTCL